MEDDLNGRRHIGKNTFIEEYLNGSQPQWKPTALQESDDISLPS